VDTIINKIIVVCLKINLFFGKAFFSVKNIN